MRRVTLATLLFPALLAAQLQPIPDRTDWSTPAAAWWSHVQFLADDKLEGRRTGTPGYEKAVRYVETQFKAAGLKPDGTQGYEQPIDLIPLSVDHTKSSLTLTTNAGETALTLPADATLSSHNDRTLSAPVVFLGYGLQIPRKHIDDYAGQDLRGKIVALYNAAPATLQGPQRAYARQLDQRWIRLRAAGAIGVLVFTPQSFIPNADKLTPEQHAAAQPQSAQGPQLTFADTDLDTRKGMRFNANLTVTGVQKLLTNTGHTLAELKSLADDGKPLPHFAIPGTLQSHTTVDRAQQVHASNVIGLLPGSDSQLKAEYVVVSAHLDHLGIGREINGDSIYNGAMDNASGIASLIEAAKLLAAQPHPRRSVLFIALTGEEVGELGSQYFATKPTVPRQNIVADLNMDMFLPLFPLRFLEIQGLGESTLGNDARAVCQLNDVEPQFDKQPDENRFVRSDQVNFVKWGIPALAFKFGWVPDSPEQKTFNDWVRTRYHKPSDDLNQPVDKIAAAQFTSLLAQLVTRVANAPTRPTWYAESSFSTPGR